MYISFLLYRKEVLAISLGTAVLFNFFIFKYYGKLFPGTSDQVGTKVKGALHLTFDLLLQMFPARTWEITVVVFAEIRELLLLKERTKRLIMHDFN
jgi:hypothetical protein